MPKICAAAAAFLFCASNCGSAAGGAGGAAAAGGPKLRDEKMSKSDTGAFVAALEVPVVDGAATEAVPNGSNAVALEVEVEVEGGAVEVGKAEWPKGSNAATDGTGGGGGLEICVDFLAPPPEAEAGVVTLTESNMSKPSPPPLPADDRADTGGCCCFAGVDCRKSKESKRSTTGGDVAVALDRADSGCGGDVGRALFGGDFVLLLDTVPALLLVAMACKPMISSPSIPASLAGMLLALLLILSPRLWPILFTAGLLESSRA